MHVETFFQAALINIDWSRDAGHVFGPRFLNSHVHDGIQRLPNVVHHYGCVVNRRVCTKVHDDTYSGEFSEPISGKLELSFLLCWSIRSLPGPVG